MSRNFNDDTIKHAYEVWEVMQREAKNRGFALTRNHREYGEGRVIIGTIGSFIKGLNSERGWSLENHETDLVRRYLKASGNVVTLNKIDQYKFRIFIREDWSNESLLKQSPREPDAIDKRAEKLRPEDVGEDKDPAPVEYRCKCGAGPFVNSNALHGHMAAHTPREKQKNTAQPLLNRVNEDLNVRQTKMLLALAANKGEIRNKNGTSPIWAKLSGEPRQYISSVMKQMVEKGYIEVERTSPKAKNTHHVTMTDKGWKLVNSVSQEWKAQRVTEIDEGWKVDPGPSPRRPVAAKPNTAVDTSDLSEFPAERLIEELQDRLTRSSQEERGASQALKEIRTVVDMVNKGKTSPLAALGEIEGLAR